MIFNLRIFKKLIKEAYKGTGLIVRREGEEYLLCGGHWAIRIEQGAFAKEYKAAVIEYIGDLPKTGKTIKASKYWGIQETELDEKVEKRLSMEGLEDTYEPVQISKVYIECMDKLCRVMQCKKKNVMMPEDLVSLVEDVKVEDDEPLDGPFSTPLQEGILYWYNMDCQYAATVIMEEELTKEHTILEALRAVELGKGKS